MKSNKLVSIIIPTFNRGTKLLNLINKFYYLRNKVEIIIINDGSQNSAGYDKIENKYRICDFITYLKLKKNFGQSYATNLGISKANTKYVWLLDDDDFIPKNTFYKVLNILKINPNIDAMLLPMSVHSNKKRVKTIHPNYQDHLYESLKKKQQSVNTSCSIFKKKILIKVGGLDSKLLGGTDTDLFLRVSKKFKFVIAKVDPVIVNINKNNKTFNFFLQQRSKIYFIKKNWNIISFKRKIYYLTSFLLFFPLLIKVKFFYRQLKKYG